MGKAGGVTRSFAHGGSVKKPQGFADGGTASADLKALDPAGSLFITEDAVEEVNPDNIQRDIPRMEWDGVDRPTPMETETESKNMLETLASGFPKAVNTAANYVVRGQPGVDMSLIPMGELASDTKALGGMLYEAFKEEPVAFFAENLPVVAQIVAGRDMNEFTGLANEARVSGDSGLADMYEQIVVLSAAGIIPGGAAANKAAKTTAVKAARDAAKATASDSARMLDEVDAVNVPRLEATQPIKFTDEYSQEMMSTLPVPVNTSFYKGADVSSSPYITPIGEIFNRQIAADPEGMIARYNAIPDTEGGKVLDTDLFRELSPNYLADRTLATDVHQTASALNKALYSRRLAETAGQEGTWIFTGGGPASGKSSGPAKDMRAGADLIYDGSMANFDAMAEKIDRALDSGKNAKLVFIDRAPERAIGLAVGRAMKQAGEYGTGRTIPKDEFVRMHLQSRETIKKLADRYKDFDNVDITVVDNNGLPGQEFVKRVEDIPDLDYNESLRKVEKSLEEMKNEGKGKISPDIHAGFNRVYSKEQVPQPNGESATPQARQSSVGRNAEQTSQPVKPLEVGVDESLSGGQRLNNYTPKNLQNLDSILADAPRGPKKDPKNLSAGNAEKDLLINAPVEAGSKVGIRLNLTSQIPIGPDLPKGLNKLQTIHRKTASGKALSYVPYATVENVTFNVNQKGRQGIAAKISNIDVPEAKNKYPAMSVDGNYVPDKNVFLSGKDFVEIGFNPKANHLFIDMNTGQAVKGADLATVVGDRVYARGVQYYKKSEAPEVLSASDGTELPSRVRYKMKRGGSVERVYNDRRYI